MKFHKYFVVLTAITIALAVPPTMNYQGKITDPDGVALNGDYDIQFSLYADSIGGTALWTETHSDITVLKGLFDVVLGTITPIDLDFDTSYWLEISVEGEIMSPRSKLSSVPYAFNARQADSAGCVKWGDIDSIPSGFADGIDDVGGETYSIELECADTITEGDAVYFGDNNRIPGYLHFKKISIQNIATKPLYDYQIRIVIGSGETDFWSFVDSEGNDIRFLDGDGKTLLSYWVESWSDGSSAIIWVKVPYIQPSQNKTIYLFYGATDAISQSDPMATFDFYEQFDEFDSVRRWENSGNWTSGESDWDWEIDATNGSPAPCFHMWSSASGTHGAKIYWCRVDGLSSSDKYALHYWLWGQCSGAEPSATLRIYDDERSSPQTVAALEECWSSTATYEEEDDYVFEPPSASIYLFFRLWDSQTGWNMSARMDDLRLRKYISPEPTVTIEKAKNCSDEGLWRAISGDGYRFLGFANESGAPGDTIEIIIGGIADCFSGLSSGMPYYLTDTPGNISESPASFRSPVGLAISATEIRLQK